MSHHADLLSLQMDTDAYNDSLRSPAAPAQTKSTGLKRLSLLGRPALTAGLAGGANRVGSGIEADESRGSSLEMRREGTGGSGRLASLDLNRSLSSSSSGAGAGAGTGDGTGLRGQGSGDEDAVDTPFTPRRIPRKEGQRSSISYAASPRTRRTDGTELDDEKPGNGAQAPLRGVTLTEEHADLLTLIAQQERKVSELRQELLAQESVLSDYKHRWTSIITQSTRPTIRMNKSPPLTGPPNLPSARSMPHSHIRRSQQTRHTAPPSGGHARSPTLDSLASSHTSLSTLSESPEPHLSLPHPHPPSHSPIPVPGPAPLALSTTLSPESLTREAQLRLTSALDDIAGSSIITSLLASVPEGVAGVAGAAGAVMSPAAIEGGKRFWGQLVRTVGAAAGGSVPTTVEVDAQSRAQVKAEVSRVVGRGTAAPVSAPAPANAHRLPRRHVVGTETDVRDGSGDRKGHSQVIVPGESSEVEVSAPRHGQPLVCVSSEAPAACGTTSWRDGGNGGNEGNEGEEGNGWCERGDEIGAGALRAETNKRDGEVRPEEVKERDKAQGEETDDDGWGWL